MVAINDNSMSGSDARRRRTQPLVNHLDRGGINLHGYVDSSPTGNVDPGGVAASGGWVPETDIGGTGYWGNTQTGASSYPYPLGAVVPGALYRPDWGEGAGPLIFNYEALVVKVCPPSKLAQAVYAARFAFASFSQFSRGNKFHVQHTMLPGNKRYAVFHASSPTNLYVTPGDAVVGNYNQVRLLQPPGYPGTEALTVGTHFLAGIRRWYVMRMSSGSFLLLTEAYERPRGPVNKFMVDYSFLGKDFAFSIWDRELLNVAQFTENYVGGKMKWGKPVNRWATFEGQTNELDNPWISSLPQSLQPHPAGGG